MVTNAIVPDRPGGEKTPTAPVSAWELRSGESTKAYSAFLAYRDLGPTRSLAAAARLVGKHPSLLKRWSQRHAWVARVQLWEAQQRAEHEESSRATIAGAYARRVGYAEQLERVAMAGLRSLVVRDPETGETRFVKGLRPADIASLIRVACHLMPTVAMEQPLVPEGEGARLTHLTGADLEFLERMLAREGLEGGAEGGSDDDAA